VSKKLTAESNRKAAEPGPVFAIVILIKEKI